jgi:hypothetical protein
MLPGPPWSLVLELRALPQVLFLGQREMLNISYGCDGAQIILMKKQLIEPLPKVRNDKESFYPFHSQSEPH